MITQASDDDRETASFKVADQKIRSLLARLSERGLCPDCTARALACHAVSFAECMLGSAKAIEMFEDIISALRENDVPDSPPSTQAH